MVINAYIWEVKTFWTAVIQDIQFIDSNIGWAVGRNGMVLHTTDGGSTWISMSSPTANNLIKLDFINLDLGWAVGSNGTIIHYDNTTGFEDQFAMDNRIVVYPNPIVNYANIKLSGNSTIDQVAIYNLNGVNLGDDYLSKDGEFNYVFNRGKLSSGIYLLTILRNNHMEAVKIVIE